VVRKDVVRNRARLVEAARAVFGERGLDATLDDVAERAGLGTGTAYRHFANKHELAAEVLGAATQQIADDAVAALSVEDPWLAIVSLFEAIGERQASDRGLYQALAGHGRAEDKIRVWPAIVESVTELFDRARAAEVIRPDAAPEDVAAIFAMLGPAFDMSDRTSTDLWRRYLVVMLDGLRASDRGPLPVPAPTFASLDDVIVVSKGRPARGGDVPSPDG